MMHKFPPVSYGLVHKYKLYYAHIDNFGNRRTYPYIKIRFSSRKAINYFKACIGKQELYVPGLRKIHVKIHEAKIIPILKFICEKDLSTASWIDFKGIKIASENQESTFQHEYQCSYHDFTLSTNSILASICPKPKVLTFDLEANSSNPNAMPDPTKPNDKIFQISCVISQQGCEEKDFKLYLLTLGNPNPIPNTEIIPFKSELELLKGFSKFIQKHNPNVIIGYNILGFDYQYMLNRSDYNRCTHDFCKQGVQIGKTCEQREISWSSSAYSNQEFMYVDPEGRLIIDMLPIVKRDHRLESYKLDYVAKHFKLAKFKQDLGHIGIFKCYREFTGESLAEVGEYCVMDSVVCLLLFEKLNTWVGLTEMANICKVPIFYLYTKGQQIKCFSQLYIESNKMNIVVEQDVYKVDENEKFVGATVVKPKEGLYDNVLMFDFASLYPSILIAYNICYTTYVVDDVVPDIMCNILDWEDHVGCEHDTDVRKVKVKKEKIICAHHRYRFLKKPKGLLPTLVEKLLNARSFVKNQLKTAKDSNNKMLVNILDNRQLAIKVSANSMYGMLGAKKGYLPLMPGAASVTAAGRMALLKTIKYIEEKEGGLVVYGDTDSVFAIWSHLKTAQECWDFSVELEKRFVGLFKAPMRLEFEEKIYKKLFILSKKRYMAIVGILSKGIVILDKDILTKGVVLTRRDNCEMLKNLYRKIVDMVFEEVHQSTIISYILDILTNVITWKCPTTEFIISKSVKNDDDYKILPAHAILAQKMRSRGLRVDSGTRIPYVLTTQGGLKAKQSVKIEDPDYFKQHKEILRIDRLYYISKLQTPIDELLLVAFGVKDFMKNFIKFQLQKQKVHRQIESFLKPVFITK
jgi:DNA polymerase elongation subunit (family B)